MAVNHSVSMGRMARHSRRSEHFRNSESTPNHKNELQITSFVKKMDASWECSWLPAVRTWKWLIQVFHYNLDSISCWVVNSEYRLPLNLIWQLNTIIHPRMVSRLPRHGLTDLLSPVAWRVKKQRPMATPGVNCLSTWFIFRGAGDAATFDLTLNLTLNSTWV